ncbi:pilus assembly PilX family protein [Marinobacterium aestuariivivens]|uniref:PilX N-terminal domain-containing pilus assembly protein n=1 Tax=Marinobacterium aestuariivivens TaxID=1698799 RepID=A0ABW2A0J0_9GAMM
MNIKSQRGAATLFVTVIILALLTVIAITVTRIGMLELKTASNTNRAKEALHTAQGGLDYGAMKYLLDTDSWSPSGAESIFIPAGSGTQVDVTASVASSYVQIEAAGESNDQTGSATVKERFTIVPVVDFGELPPLMAGGNFPPSGTFSIVGNPNGGGDGVPVSAWVETSQTQGSQAGKPVT